MQGLRLVPAFGTCFLFGGTRRALSFTAKDGEGYSRRGRGRVSCSANALGGAQDGYQEKHCHLAAGNSNRSMSESLETPAQTAADAKLMQVALGLAREAYAAGEVPVGAVLVNGSGEIIGRGRNRVEALGDATAHAEMEALRAQEPGGRSEEGWRRGGCTLYTTLEPCAMCFSAASLARVRRIVYGAPDHRLGACGTWIDLQATSHPFHTLDDVTSGVCASEAAALMKDFFRERRQQPKFK